MDGPLLESHSRKEACRNLEHPRHTRVPTVKKLTREEKAHRTGLRGAALGMSGAILYNLKHYRRLGPGLGRLAAGSLGGYGAGRAFHHVKTSSLDFSAFTDELEKISSSPVTASMVGAGLGASVLGLRGALKEWDRYLAAKPKTELQRRQMKRDSLVRIGGGAALGALGGGVVGHFGGKGVDLIKRHAKDISSDTAHVLEKGFGNAIRKELVGGMVNNSQVIGHNLASGAAKGVSPELDLAMGRAASTFMKSISEGAGRVGSNLTEGIMSKAPGVGEMLVQGIKKEGPAVGRIIGENARRGALTVSSPRLLRARAFLNRLRGK